MLLADRPALQLGRVRAGGDPHDRGGAARLHREPVRRKLQPGVHRLAFFAGGIVEAQREKACAGGSTGDDARLLEELAPAFVHQCSSPAGWIGAATDFIRSARRSIHDRPAFTSFAARTPMTFVPSDRAPETRWR